MPIRAEFLEERISALEALIVQYEEALMLLTDNPTASYSLDTGQDVVRYTRQDIDVIQKMRDSALSSLSSWQNRLTGGNAVVVTPCF